MAGQKLGRGAIVVGLAQPHVVIAQRTAAELAVAQCLELGAEVLLRVAGGKLGVEGIDDGVDIAGGHQRQLLGPGIGAVAAAQGQTLEAVV